MKLLLQSNQGTVFPTCKEKGAGLCKYAQLSRSVWGIKPYLSNIFFSASLNPVDTVSPVDTVNPVDTVSPDNTVSSVDTVSAVDTA